MEFNFDTVKEVLKQFPVGFVFTTIQVIEKYGELPYAREINTPPSESTNADMGRYLKRNSIVLKIVEVNAGVPQPMHQTTSSEWRVIER